MFSYSICLYEGVIHIDFAPEKETVQYSCGIVFLSNIPQFHFIPGGIFLTPEDRPPCFVQCLDRSVFFFQKFPEIILALRTMAVAHTGMTDLIIQLPGNNIFMPFQFFRHFCGNLMGIMPVGDGRRTGMLSYSECTSVTIGFKAHDLRIFFTKPCRCGGTGGTHDDIYMMFFQNIAGIVKPLEVIYPLFRFHSAPGKFPDADDVYSGFLHQKGIILNSFIIPVFRIISGSDIYFHFCTPFL